MINYVSNNKLITNERINTETDITKHWTDWTQNSLPKVCKRRSSDAADCVDAGLVRWRYLCTHIRLNTVCAFFSYRHLLRPGDTFCYIHTCRLFDELWRVSVANFYPARKSKTFFFLQAVGVLIWWWQLFYIPNRGQLSREHRTKQVSSLSVLSLFNRVIWQTLSTLSAKTMNTSSSSGGGDSLRMWLYSCNNVPQPVRQYCPHVHAVQQNDTSCFCLSDRRKNDSLTQSLTLKNEHLWFQILIDNIMSVSTIWGNMSTRQLYLRN